MSKPTAPFCNRWRIEGVLELTSPLHIGSGQVTTREKIVGEQNKLAEINAVAIDASRAPCIPGSALKGVLRSWLQRQMPKNPRLDALMGHPAETADSDDASGGKLSVRDAVFISGPPDASNVSYWCQQRHTGVVARVALDRSRKTAIPQRLFYLEYAPAGSRFQVVVEGQNLDDDEVALLLFALDGFQDQSDPVTLGAETGNGWGLCSWTLQKISRIDSKDVIGRIRDCLRKNEAMPAGFGLCEHVPEVQKALIEKARQFQASTNARWLKYSVTLRFDGPFLVNDPYRCKSESDPAGSLPNHAPRLDEKRHVLLPGTSFRGALRAQAERIARTLNPAQAPSPDLRASNSPYQNLIEFVFGEALWASVLRCSEFRSRQPVREVLPKQEFVAIDRFTGGAAETAKFSAEFVDSPVLEGDIWIDLKGACRLRVWAQLLVRAHS